MKIEKDEIRLGRCGTMFSLLKENDELTIEVKGKSIKGKMVSRDTRGINLLLENGDKKVTNFNHSEITDVIIDGNSPTGKFIKRAIELNVSNIF